MQALPRRLRSSPCLFLSGILFFACPCLLPGKSARRLPAFAAQNLSSACLCRIFCRCRLAGSYRRYCRQRKAPSSYCPISPAFARLHDKRHQSHWSGSLSVLIRLSSILPYQQPPFVLCMKSYLFDHSTKSYICQIFFIFLDKSVRTK